MSSDAWQVFSVGELARHIGAGEPVFKEFLRTRSLSCAIYQLPAGSRDMQSPHMEDEVYLVIKGRARLRAGTEESVIGAGSILYVRATAEHSFFDIEEDLTVIAIFGPQAKA